jgi:hypothetical protein
MIAQLSESFACGASARFAAKARRGERGYGYRFAYTAIQFYAVPATGKKRKGGSIPVGLQTARDT